MARGEESAPASPIASGLADCTSTASDRFTSLAKRKMQKHIKAAKIKMPERGAYSTSAPWADLSICLVSMRHQVAWRRFNRWAEISRCDPGGTSDEGWRRLWEEITTGAGEDNRNQRRGPVRPIDFQGPFRKVRNHVADILGEQFRLFHSREMPAASHLGPTLHIEESLSPFARRLTDILRKECEGRRHAGRAGPLLHPLL